MGAFGWPRLVAWTFLGLCVVLGFWLSFANLKAVWVVNELGVSAHNGKGPTHDFTNMWIGGRLALTDRLPILFDPLAYWAVLNEEAQTFYRISEWSYPPTMLLLAVLTALAPLYVSFAFWSVCTLAFFLGMARAGKATPVVLIAFAISPAVVCNFMFGQNGALTAACLIGGYALAIRRPIVAGALIGLLAVKPHAALLAPLCFAAARAWRAFFVAGACVLLLGGLSVAAFGLETWRSFFSHTTPLMVAYLEDAPLQHYHRQGVTVFLLARTLGADLPLAYAVQAVATAAAAFVAWRLWRGPCSDPLLRAAVTALLGVLASAYGYTYELFALTFTALLLVARDGGRSPALLALLGVAWVWPLLSIFVTVLFYPLTPLVASAVVYASWRALRAP
jgi:hypothetical protein